ncbi:hypothetical protein, partial [Pelomonas sp. KK5]|uniref:hypothetical protein n=1 Tax=Pelomonas sp. KK5 TaxID=1855730 RepID=UPI00097C1E75
LGATQLRWRSTAEPLAPELPLERHQHRSVKPSALWLAVALPVWLLALAFEQWLGADPGTSLVEYAAPVLGPLAAVLAWSALWALVTQLFQHRFPFATHLRRVLAWLLAIYAIGLVVPGLAYAFSLPRLLGLEEIVMAAGSAALIWWHAVVVWPRARRGLALGLGVLLVLGMGLTLARRLEQQHWFGPTYLSALPPPALRMASPKPPQALLDELQPLRDKLARQASKDNDQAPAEEEE